MFAALDKLVKCKFRVLVLVHIPKNLVDPLKKKMRNRNSYERAGCACLFRSVFIRGQFDHFASHLVYGLNDLKHLVISYRPVLVYVVKLERPWRKVSDVHRRKLKMNGGTFEFFLETTATGDAQSADEFFEVDVTALVGIEDVEDILGEFSWITEREELFVDAAEFGLVEVA